MATKTKTRRDRSGEIVQHLMRSENIGKAGGFDDMSMRTNDAFRDAYAEEYHQALYVVVMLAREMIQLDAIDAALNGACCRAADAPALSPMPTRARRAVDADQLLLPLEVTA
jgi:hypothetical protein